MKRRNFIKNGCSLCAMGMVSAGVLLESCNRNSQTPEGPTVNFTLDLNSASNSALNNAGGSVSSHGVVIVNTGSDFAAVAQACTHQGCSVSYSSSQHNLHCPCHGGVFDLNGKVKSGPPPAPLKTYTVTQNGTVLTIAG
ncbi:MAG: Rieske 2Fe-2S domain-containing protein [Flavobacteriales bacterium]|nr:Rieske 2Fe-2S domain-containing protein [Flavobacteriales bacterium]